MKEKRISLNEVAFTNICKNGFIYHQSDNGRVQINITKRDIQTLMGGEILTKVVDGEKVLLLLQDIGSFTISEIVKRSPIYSDIVVI